MMTQEQKDFILKELIPFILREQGAGFAMSSWISHCEAGTNNCMDGVFRYVPPCGTVACIGGSTEYLVMKKEYTKRLQTEPSLQFSDLEGLDQDYIDDALGLTSVRAHTLFFGWRGGGSTNYGWPANFIKRYSAERTTLGKAEVAADLLRKVVETEGAILDP